MIEIFAYLGSIITFVLIIYLVRMAKIQIRDAVIWVIWCVVLVLFGVLNKSILEPFSNSLFEKAILIFTYLLAFFSYIVIIYLSVKISSQTKKIRQLTQIVAIIENKQKKYNDSIINEIKNIKKKIT